MKKLILLAASLSVSIISRALDNTSKDALSLQEHTELKCREGFQYDDFEINTVSIITEAQGRLIQHCYNGSLIKCSFYAMRDKDHFIIHNTALGIIEKIPVKDGVLVHPETENRGKKSMQETASRLYEAIGCELPTCLKLAYNPNS